MITNVLPPKNFIHNQSNKQVRSEASSLKQKSIQDRVSFTSKQANTVTSPAFNGFKLPFGLFGSKADAPKEIAQTSTTSTTQDYDAKKVTDLTKAVIAQSPLAEDSQKYHLEKRIDFTEKELREKLNSPKWTDEFYFNIITESGKKPIRECIRCDIKRLIPPELNEQEIKAAFIVKDIIGASVQYDMKSADNFKLFVRNVGTFGAYDYAEMNNIAVLGHASSEWLDKHTVKTTINP